MLMGTSAPSGCEKRDGFSLASYGDYLQLNRRSLMQKLDGPTRRFALVVVGGIILNGSAFAQGRSQKPQLSEKPLTGEQVAVYRAVLKSYTRDSAAGLNISNTIAPLNFKELASDKRCIQGINLVGTDNSVLTIRRLSSSVLLNSEMILVDRDRQLIKVKQNDPEILIKKAIDDGDQLSDELVKEAVKKAYSTGLFALSQITFDKTHHHAIVSYSFVCGMLCGNGGVLVLEKHGDNWTVSRTCDSWVS